MSGIAFAAIIIGSIIAGFVQSLSGFGSGVILAIIFSQFFNTVEATALTLSVCLALTVYLSLKFKKHIEWKLILLPLIPYLIISSIINKIMNGLNVSLLGILFGVFQIVLAVYYLFVSSAIKPSKSAVTGLTVGCLSGTTVALFGVGGPFLSLYMVAVSSSPKSYTANLQLFFVITNIIVLGEKLAAGHYPSDYWLYSVAGAVAIVIGARLGVSLINKLDAEKMKRIIYWFLLVSGVVTILQNTL